MLYIIIIILYDLVFLLLHLYPSSFVWLLTNPPSNPGGNFKLTPTRTRTNLTADENAATLAKRYKAGVWMDRGSEEKGQSRLKTRDCLQWWKRGHRMTDQPIVLKWARKHDIESFFSMTKVYDKHKSGKTKLRPSLNEMEKKWNSDFLAIFFLAAAHKRKPIMQWGRGSS